MRKELRCSFCGEKDSEVAKLVAGPHVYICDVCITIASRLISDDSNADIQEPKASLWRRLLTRFRRGGCLNKSLFGRMHGYECPPTSAPQAARS